jgi:hypothetical protein
MVMVVERRDATTGAWSFPILVSIPLHCIVCHVKVIVNTCGSKTETDRKIKAQVH